MDRQRIEQTLREVLTAQPRIMTAYLFGSVARGTDRPGSDVDVGVLLDAPPPPTLAGLCLDLEDDLRETLRRPVVVRSIVEDHLNDLLGYVAAIRRRLS